MSDVVLSIWRGEVLVPPYKPTIKTTLAWVAEKHGLTVEELKTGGPARRFSGPRQEAMYELRKLGKSYPQIAAAVGLTDHTSAVYGCRKHESRLSVKVAAE